MEVWDAVSYRTSGLLGWTWCIPDITTHADGDSWLVDLCFSYNQQGTHGYNTNWYAICARHIRATGQAKVRQYSFGKYTDSNDILSWEKCPAFRFKPPDGYFETR